MPKPLTRQQLDQGRCMAQHEHGEACGAHGPLYMHGACHPGAGNDVLYDHGVLKLSCHECKAVVVEILVAQRTPPPAPPARSTVRSTRRRP